MGVGLKVRHFGLKTMIALVVVTILFTNLATYLVFSNPSPSRDIYLDDLPSTATFVINTDGAGEYWATKYDGSIAYSGNNASQIIQNSLNQLNNGGSIYIRHGTYPLDTYINIPYDGIEIRLDKYAILESHNTANGVWGPPAGTFYTTIFVNHKDYFRLEGGIIDGDNAHVSYVGVLLIGTSFAQIEDTIFTRLNHGNAIYFNSGNKKFTVSHVTVDHRDNDANGNCGFDNWNNTNAEGQYIGCKVFGNADLLYGWLITDSNKIDIIQPQISNVTNNGIWIEGQNTETWNSTYNSIVGGWVDTVTQYHSIRISNGTRNRVVGIAVKNAQGWGLLEDGVSDYNIIIASDFSGVIGGILASGANTKVNLCWNGTTWIP